MVRHIDAIFSQGAFRPLEPLVLPEGMRVHVRIVQQENHVPSPPKFHAPKLAHPEDAADFVMEVGEAVNAEI